MDQNLKKKIVIVKGLIQKKQYKQALDELQVLIYKYQKAYQVHLMSGLCYQKIDKQFQAQKCYKQVIDLKEDEPNAIKALCQIYSKRNDIKNAVKFLEKNVEILKNVDENKHREALVKLVLIYKKDDCLQKIFTVFMDYVEKQEEIGEDFVQIADAYFQVSIGSKSFNLQKFEMMGFKGQTPRVVQINARQRLNILLIDVINYLMAVSKQFNLSQKDIANYLYEMKYCFPYAPSMLMLLLLDEFCVGHVNFSGIILEEIYKLLTSYYKKQDNGYINMQFTEPQIFTIQMVLGYQYLAFFKEFFTLNACFDEYFQDLALKQEQFLKSSRIRQDYSKKINNFILKKCRYLSKMSQTKNVEKQIQQMKKRIQALDGSFLQEVIAKMAMNCFVNYQQLDDMKNMLKIRIKNLQQGDMVPHLYKYYVDYLMKIAKIYKILDQEINIYEAIDYINKYDPKDTKYQIQGYWLNFSRSMLLEDKDQKIRIAKTSIQNIYQVINGTTGELKAQALRKIAVMKVFAGDFQIEKQLKEAVLLDRSFPNLQCVGFYHFYKNHHQEALNYLKQAFILNQNHYHTNRLIFVLLFKLGFKSQAIDFVERVKEGFRSAFWINYVLALKYMNLKKYTDAQYYLNASIQSYSAGYNKKFKFSYQKTVSHESFAYLYMIQQNQFSILYDQIIFPQKILYDQIKMVSSLHFQFESKRTQVKLFYQMGQVLKILGRTKSSLNYLGQAYTLSQELSQEQVGQPGQKFQICIMQKQYATILFYMQMFRQCQFVLSSSYNLCKAELQSEKNEQKRILLEEIQSQIRSLSFEVAVLRLSIMLKFESRQTVEQYLTYFDVQQPKRPSVNFLKGKYQFHILQYVHRRHGIQNIKKSISKYLNFFSLQLDDAHKIQFQNKYFQLDSNKKLMVKQALEDYFVIKYISAPQKLNQTQLMPLIQLFPRSTIFYIIFGMSTSDLKLKTAAFLKCIQLDKQSPISIDLLASLYLKQKNYLAATKLFLKSLQMDILNSKCYLGLSICLFCIIGKSIQTNDQQVITIVHKALVRINSYMQYLRTVDPSENYHLLRFLKLLVNDENTSNFDMKTVLQASRKNTKYKYKDTLIYSLLQQATSEWKEHNIWQQQGQVKILQEFVVKFYKNKPQDINQQCLQIARRILENSAFQLKELCQDHTPTRKYQFLLKQIQKIINQICVGVSLAQKCKFDQKFFLQAVQILCQIQKRHERLVLLSEQNTTLIKKLKFYLFQYCLLNSQFERHKNTVKFIFNSIYSYEHLMRYSHLMVKYQNQLFRQVLLNPNNEELKRTLSNHMVVSGGKPINKGKLDYKVQLINNAHQNLTLKKQTLKKLCLLYRDPYSYIGYISMCWEGPNERTKKNIQLWLGIIKKIQGKLSGESNDKLRETNSQKLKALKVEIYSFYIMKHGYTQQSKKIGLKLQKEENSSLQLLVSLGTFYSQSSPQNLQRAKELFVQTQTPERQLFFLQLLSHITNKYQYSKPIQQILIQLIQTADDHTGSHFKSHLLLLRYLYVLHRPIKTQDHLVSQIVDMEKLIAECQQSTISENTISILKCSKCLFSADYQNLSIELGVAAHKKIVTQSDQVLVNFFQIMRLYKQVQTNPNKEGVIQEFAIYIEHMILLMKDPFYQGFFFTLKAMVNSIIVPDQPIVQDRNLRFSLILSPYASKVFVKNHQH